LEAELRAYEKLSSIEIMVVTVSSLGERTVADYGNDLFTAWGIGKKGMDNGVLILLAPTEKKWVIRTGYGVEGYLTDAQASQIGRDAAKSHKGNYPVIIQTMVANIKATLGDFTQEQRQEYAQQKQIAKQKTDEEIKNFMIWSLVLFGVLCIIIIPIALRARRKRLVQEKEEVRNIEKYRAEHPYVHHSSPLFPIVPPPERHYESESRRRVSEDDEPTFRHSVSDNDESSRNSSNDDSSFEPGGGDTGGGGADGDL
ncbi:MAG: TPM domain-containing protein, partial [Candidatus Paceibacterota bacterium]